jgi:hypothetical protein
MFKRRSFTFFFTIVDDKWNIFIIRDNFQTLMDIIIIDSTRTNMAQITLTTITHVVMMIT